MKRSNKISLLMTKLLIKNALDGFTVMELRDASINTEGISSDLEEARKKVYRQIYRFEKNNWLRSEGSGQKKRYFQTELFKKSFLTTQKDEIEANTQATYDYSILNIERNQYKGELEIVLGEIKEYKALRCRFPELESKVIPLLDNSKERAAHLLGKVNVLSNILNVISEGKQAC
ncbi:hypothetical protein [Photobacterium carnosum]|uniref:Transcriptional regulator VspR n=1 Tax=Photobacterium carnosum TaxID=2023717 RepID=A0A2N4UWI2_9GAMM|nr:hypothetical protein [Photobacterium carnosum]PLC59368.1 hypothetical protein CIK00_03600 [Photobacterium carnosum]